MNADHITALLEVRSQLLSLRDLEHNPDTSPIDDVLRQIPEGENNDVDLALGRRGAVLPPRVKYNVSHEVSAADIAEMEARTAETATEPPTYDGMWM